MPENHVFVETNWVVAIAAPMLSRNADAAELLERRSARVTFDRQPVDRAMRRAARTAHARLASAGDRLAIDVERRLLLGTPIHQSSGVPS